MAYSPHQQAYFAHQLTRRAASNSMDRMAGGLAVELDDRWAATRMRSQPQKRIG